MGEKPSYEELLRRIDALEREKRDQGRAVEGVPGGVNDDDLNLGDILDVKKFKTLMDDFSQLTRMVTAILDLNGHVIQAGGWQDICTRFHRVNAVTAQCCRESDLFLSKDLSPGEYREYKCKNGLWDVVTPLYLKGRHMGNIYTGQFFYDDEHIDPKWFESRADTCGFDKESYMDAFHRIPRYSRKTVRNLMGFLSQLTAYISQISLANLRFEREMAHRQQAEAALKESEAYLRILIRSLPDLVWMKDADGVYRFCNSKFERFLGATEAEIIGKTDYDFLDKTLADVFRENDALALAKGKPRINEETVTYADDGHLEVLETIKVPLLNQDGSLAGVLGIGRDITHRKQTEDALLENERLLKEMGRLATIGGWEFDPQTLDGTWTDEVARIHDMDPGDETNVNVGLSVYRGEYRAIIEQAVKEAIEQGKSFDLELKMTTPKGNVKWVRSIGHPVRVQGKVVKVTGAVQDISEKKKAEEEIRALNRKLELRVHQRTVQLEEAHKELEDFVYSVSHDLRAPLRSISGFAQIIDRRHKSFLNDEGRHYFENIIKAGNQMGELIDDLLQFSRMGRKAVKSGPVSLNDVVKTAMDTLSDLISSTGAEMTVPETLPKVQGDPVLLTHMVINLLENALKYHDVNVPPRIGVRAELLDDTVALSISDNGIGIAPEYHDKIFTMFQRLHSQDEYPGTGIGLTAVKKAVQMMEGGIALSSTPGQGSTFTVTLTKA